MSSSENAPPRLLASADDRTGALEVGGILASPDRPTPVGPHAKDPVCSVVDIDSRQVEAEVAFERVVSLHKESSEFRCHKMDAGLRGNWPHECKALVELGYRVAVVPSFPDAGRRCKAGVVYINNVPVLESPFGSDPFTAPCSSRPMDVLEEADCIHDDISVWDADNNQELEDMIDRCLEEDRVLVGPTGALGVYGSRLLPSTGNLIGHIPKPVLVVCGSLNQTSRRQTELLDVPTFSLNDPIEPFDQVVLLETENRSGSIEQTEAQEVGKAVAERVHQQIGAIASFVVIGGDTVKAIVEDNTLLAFGTVAAGIPISIWENRTLVTKGGGIGEEDTLRQLLVD